MGRDRYRSRQRSNAVSATVGMMLILVGLSVLVPALYFNLDNPQTTALDHELGQRTVITGDVNAELSAVKPSQGSVNMSVWDRRTGDSDTTGELAVGSSANVTIAGQNITVTNKAILSDTRALVEYDYPLYIGWPDGSSVLVENTPLILMLAAVMLMVGIVLAVTRRQFT